MMRTRTLHYAAAVALCSGVAQAQTETEASGGASLSLTEGLSTEGSADATQSEGVPDATASEDANAEASYGERYKPEAGIWEVGLFGSLFFPSPRHKLYQVRQDLDEYESVAPGLGARIAFYPTSWLGLEGEFMMADGRVPHDLDYVRPDLESNRATFHAYRAHAVFQLPVSSVVPFFLAGVSALGTNSQPLGRDTDATFHAGAGLKIPFDKWFSLRADFRENMHSRINDKYSGIAFSEEIQLGATFTFGRSEPKAPEVVPAADRDKDTVVDELDKCPETPALTEDGCPLDTDGDGISDPDDYCPREKGEAPNGCPNLDPDKDNILLPCDQCPTEPGVAPDGCPIRDTDGDGILDDTDKCPKEAETKNGFEDTDGCPDEIPKEMKAFTGTIQGITFDRGKATIRKASEKTLKAAVDVLKKFPSIRLEISGHTSSEGDEGFNQRLSEDRAAAVRQWMLDHDIVSSRITSRGAGSSEPVADNKTEAGRQKNRRIEFAILKQ